MNDDDLDALLGELGDGGQDAPVRGAGGEGLTNEADVNDSDANDGDSESSDVDSDVVDSDIDSDVVEDSSIYDSDAEDSDADDADFGDEPESIAAASTTTASTDDNFSGETAMSSEDEMADESVTQVEVYENLKRIGELEDEKQVIQEELRARTEKLRAMLKHIDRGSILYKMLSSALHEPAAGASTGRGTKKGAKSVEAKGAKKPPREAAKPKPAKKPPAKKTPRKS